MDFKWKTSFFERLGTCSIDNEYREKWIEYSPSVKNTEGVPAKLDFDYFLIFVSIVFIILTCAAGVGVYHLYDLYVYWYPDHLFHHQRFIETFHLW